MASSTDERYVTAGVAESAVAVGCGLLLEVVAMRPSPDVRRSVDDESKNVLRDDEIDESSESAGVADVEDESAVDDVVARGDVEHGLVVNPLAECGISNDERSRDRKSVV